MNPMICKSHKHEKQVNCLNWEQYSCHFHRGWGLPHQARCVCVCVYTQKQYSTPKMTNLTSLCASTCPNQGIQSVAKHRQRRLKYVHSLHTQRNARIHTNTETPMHIYKRGHVH